MKARYLIQLILTLVITSQLAQAQNLIPKPNIIGKPQSSAYKISEKTKITYADKTLLPQATILQGYLTDLTGKKLAVEQSDTSGGIHLELEQKMKLSREEYVLNSGGDGVEIRGKTKAGVFNGITTLIQLFQQDKKENWEVAARFIHDKPVYPWRGMMLDPARYFMTKEYILRYIDMMAMHKLNVLHFHIVDDCGWRIEIKKYPKLTEIGAWRGKGDKKHGGFYTQEDIKEMVAYAAERNIEIVPEIEMPAHTLSALAAYPELGCFNKKFTVPERHSISPELYCVGKESTWEFLENVFDEVVELFPSKYVHIGGDEAKYPRWKACPNCQKCIKDNKLKNERELQGWATNRLEKYLATKDKKLVGWAEIFHAGASKSSGIMAWHKASDAVEAAKNGNPVIMSLVRHTYFDTPESKLPGEPAAANWTPPVTLEKAYNWSVTPAGLTPEQQKNILGPNGCVWNDRFLHNAKELADKPGKGTTASEAYVDYLSLPRMAALAEVGWTEKSQRDFGDFQKRMASQYGRYVQRGYHFRVPVPEPEVEKQAEGSFSVKYESGVDDATTRYTLDGSEPTTKSPELSNSLKAPKGSTIKAKTFLDGTKMSSLTFVYKEKANKFAKHGRQFGSWKSGKVAADKAREESYDATGFIDSNGKYEITFLYISGEHALNIKGIKVLRNDRDLSAKNDKEGRAGASPKMSKYRIKIKNYETGASFKVKANVYGDEGSDSNGVVLIKKIK